MKNVNMNVKIQKISKKEIRNFDKSEQLKSTADNKRKNGKALERKIIFAYSKIISKYAVLCYIIGKV